MYNSRTTTTTTLFSTATILVLLLACSVTQAMPSPPTTQAAIDVMITEKLAAFATSGGEDGVTIHADKLRRIFNAGSVVDDTTKTTTTTTTTRLDLNPVEHPTIVRCFPVKGFCSVLVPVMLPPDTDTKPIEQALKQFKQAAGITNAPVPKQLFNFNVKKLFGTTYLVTIKFANLRVSDIISLLM